jgi:hypothetical protein
METQKQLHFLLLLAFLGLYVLLLHPLKINADTTNKRLNLNKKDFIF